MHSFTVDDIAWSPYDSRTLATSDNNRSFNVFQVGEELFKGDDTEFSDDEEKAIFKNM